MLFGEAAVDANTPPANQNLAYLDKYAAGIADIGMTPDSFSKEYAVPLRVIPDRLHGF